MFIKLEEIWDKTLLDFPWLKLSVHFKYSGTKDPNSYFDSELGAWKLRYLKIVSPKPLKLRVIGYSLL